MSNTEEATFGAGCFWCVEAIFQRVHGVRSVVSGYSGGEKDNPTYEEVSAGNTGHAEVIRIKYDPNEVTYEELLNLFWRCHDPTSLNRQGNDVGTQYRSVIFTHNEWQMKSAEESKIAAKKNFDKPIVTEISELKNFYPAEEYHHDYYRNNPDVPYCRFVIRPKLEKLQ